MVFIPPLKVYNQINKIVMETVAQNGTPYASNKIICNTFATKNNRNAAPIVLESKKKLAPVL